MFDSFDFISTQKSYD